MLYVQQSLSPEEEIVQIGHFHWIYTMKAILAVVWGIIGCIGVIVVALYTQDHFLGGFEAQSIIEKIQTLHPAIRIGAFFVFIFGVLRFAHMMVTKATTEIAVTNSRLIYKRGLVARYVGEISIDRIEGINVLQTVMGRLFGYGRLMVRGMGVGEIILPPIANPVAFRRAIEQARKP